MLYEIVGVVRPGRINEVKDIVRSTGNIILRDNGVVRGITNWGTMLLPRRIKKYQAYHDTGHYFIMRFDSSIKTQHSVSQTLGLDPRLLRYSLTKMGTKLEDIADVRGKVDWSLKDRMES